MRMKLHPEDLQPGLRKSSFELAGAKLSLSIHQVIANADLHSQRNPIQAGVEMEIVDEKEPVGFPIRTKGFAGRITEIGQDQRVDRLVNERQQKSCDQVNAKASLPSPALKRKATPQPPDDWKEREQ